MNVDKNKLQSVINASIKQAIAQFENSNNGETLTDVYMQIDKENNKLIFFDDMENLLIEETFELLEDADTIQVNASFNYFIKVVKSSLQELNKTGLFDKDYILKPFSICLVDDSFFLIEELLFLDDENLKIGGEPLIDLDKELNDFLSNLLSDL